MEFNSGFKGLNGVLAHSFKYNAILIRVSDGTVAQQSP